MAPTCQAVRNIRDGTAENIELALIAPGHEARKIAICAEITFDELSQLEYLGKNLNR